ncbi:hypothetical protein [Myroides odoratimimus]|uniref:DUF1963 domain-containing protein n=1 Tax=Myroides odoratimimus TaxID=76832 RepID=A0AAI8C6H4_9FLAO|nr:hypothetical protein [Myroides odoratimimus]ALU27029.1 hypothetical protein AS202_13100 [Myroides odoratimimus]MCA4806335.1 hypothetical protein [Myroides odoratimimus]MCO7722283.1 hypothetical protein [Myroides odoratimimus]MDM1093308.1 hypothetical protein [Myroides odoratimimus]MDM1095477.1 hypothetical protein [Myroides odoratimimus]
MSSKGQQLAIDYKQTEWKTPDVYNQLRGLMKDEVEIYAFCLEFLMNIEKDSTLFHSALSYVNEKDFSQLVKIAIDILKEKESAVAESVIEYAGIQLPHILHPYLDDLLVLNPNGDSYFADYHWRNCTSAQLQPYSAQFLALNTDLETKIKLFNCLVESRDITTIESLIPHALELELSTYVSSADYIDGYLEGVGLCREHGKVKRYCSDQTYHILFEPKYLNKPSAVHLNRTDHPTWNGVPLTNKYKVGGYLAEDENNPFMHIITLNPIPEGLPIRLSQLVLGCHLRELNENGVVFYQHDEQGIPHKIGEPMTIEWVEEHAMVPTEVSIVPTDSRWAFQSWASANSRENLFRIGGEPSWVQSGEVLTCPISGEKMQFIMQLDSEVPDVQEGEVYYGSGGLCYIFWCDKTKVSGYIMQHT